MIAEGSYRRKGLAGEALEAVHEFAKHCGKQKIVAKINTDNEGSVGLFKKLGYTFVQEVVAFGQLEFEKTL